MTTSLRVWARTAPDCPLTAEIGFVIDGDAHVLRLGDRELISLYDELHKVVMRRLDREAGDVHISYMPLKGDG